jgi:phosphoglycerate dehydrogenase-like enzyme
LALLPAGAIVVIVARGGLVADEALLEALDAGRIRGAVLDVFHTEPLPPFSPYWQHSRVLVTPHVSGVSPRRQWARALALFEDNWRRWVAGSPLRNVVDLDAGYCTRGPRSTLNGTRVRSSESSGAVERGASVHIKAAMVRAR